MHEGMGQRAPGVTGVLVITGVCVSLFLYLEMGTG